MKCGYDGGCPADATHTCVPTGEVRIAVCRTHLREIVNGSPGRAADVRPIVLSPEERTSARALLEVMREVRETVEKREVRRISEDERPAPPSDADGPREARGTFPIGR